MGTPRPHWDQLKWSEPWQRGLGFFLPQMHGWRCWVLGRERALFCWGSLHRPGTLGMCLCTRAHAHTHTHTHTGIKINHIYSGNTDQLTYVHVPELAYIEYQGVYTYKDTHSHMTTHTCKHEYVHSLRPTHQKVHFRNSLVAQRVKGLALSLLWLG